MEANQNQYAMTFEQHESKRRGTKRLLIGIFCVLVLFMAGAVYGLYSSTALEREVKAALPTGMSANQKAYVQNALKVWGEELPGLEQARRHLRFLKVEYGYPYFGFSKKTSITWLLFSMEDGVYSRSHHADGVILRVGVLENGAGLILQNNATQYVFLGQEVDSHGQDYFVPMR